MEYSYESFDVLHKTKKEHFWKNLKFWLELNIKPTNQITLKGGVYRARNLKRRKISRREVYKNSYYPFLILDTGTAFWERAISFEVLPKGFGGKFEFMTLLKERWWDHRSPKQLYAIDVLWLCEIVNFVNHTAFITHW